MAFDQPLFALAKYVQWSWPQTLGEESFVVMFGGLHIEMAIWDTIGDFLDCSGWTSALCEAGVATSGIADSFLKAIHLTRTRHSHQITALVLANLRQNAWESSEATHDDFERWKLEMIEKSPTFQFWDLVLEFEIIAMIFIRAHRSNDFNLFVCRVLGSPGTLVLCLRPYQLLSLDSHSYSGHAITSQCCMTLESFGSFRRLCTSFLPCL